jgi:hypothetical protein
MYEFNRLGRSEGHDVDLEHVLAPSIELGRGKKKNETCISVCTPWSLRTSFPPSTCRLQDMPEEKSPENG